MTIRTTSSACVALIMPNILESLNYFWFRIGMFLGAIISPVIIGGIFFILITPIAILTRIFGRDVLLIAHKNASTHWVERSSVEESSFKNQF